jgi:hypothetical protein
MRGAFVDQGGLFSYIAPGARVPANHPLRKPNRKSLSGGTLTCAKLERSVARDPHRAHPPPSHLPAAAIAFLRAGLLAMRTGSLIKSGTPTFSTPVVRRPP